MFKKFMLFSVLLSMFSMVLLAEPTEFVVGNTKICVEFYTPQTVRVVKSLKSHDYEKQSLVVTTKHDDVKISQKGNSAASPSCFPAKPPQKARPWNTMARK